MKNKFVKSCTIVALLFAAWARAGEPLRPLPLAKTYALGPGFIVKAAPQTHTGGAGGGGGASPGGSNTQVQYNKAGSLGGVAQWTTNGTTDLIGSDLAHFKLGQLDVCTGLYPTPDAAFCGGNSSNAFVLQGLDPYYITIDTRALGSGNMGLDFQTQDGTDAFLIAQDNSDSGTAAVQFQQENGIYNFAAASFSSTNILKLSTSSLGYGSSGAQFVVASGGKISTYGGGPCASSGGTCGASASGSVSIAAAATTVTVATTGVATNSQIFVQEDSTRGTALSVTCNTTLGRSYAITARTAGTSFVITASAAPSVNPACLDFFIVN